MNHSKSKQAFASVLAVFCLNCSIHQAFAQNAQTGFTGLLRIPDARVVDYGSLRFSNAWEADVRHSTGYSQGAHHTALLNLGIAPDLEISVQNAYKRINGAEPGYNKGGASDLSFSAKYVLTKWLPQLGFELAIGAQDLSKRSSARYHANQYVVGTLPLGDAEFTLGLGLGDNTNQMGSGYLNGIFAGAKYNYNRHISLLADYDGTGFNVGASAQYRPQFLPTGWQTQLKLQLASTSKTANRDNAFLALGLEVPLGYTSHTQLQPVAQLASHASLEPQRLSHTYDTSDTYNTGDDAQGGSHEPAYTLTPHYLDKKLDKKHVKVDSAKDPKQDSLTIAKALEAQGFENVRVGTHLGTRIITIENNIFLGSQARAIGEAIQTVMMHDDNPAKLVLLVNNQPALEVGFVPTVINEAIANPVSGRSTLGMQFHYPDPHILSSVKWHTPVYGSSRYLPRAQLSPYLKSILGTEWGVIDYALGLASNFKMDLWTGAMVDVRHILRLTESDDVGYLGHPLKPLKNTIDRAVIHQTLKPSSSVTSMFTAGLMHSDLLGVVNETQWLSQTGQHKVYGTIGEYTKKNKAAKNYSVQALGYRYFLPSFQHAIDASISRVNDDKSVNATLQNWFGDVRADVTFAKYIDGETYAGLKFNFPLARDKSMKPNRGFQVTGVPQWSWGYKTQVSGPQNIVKTERDFNSFAMQHGLASRFDRDRLSPKYLARQLDYIYTIIGSAKQTHSSIKSAKTSQ